MQLTIYGIRDQRLKQQKAAQNETWYLAQIMSYEGTNNRDNDDDKRQLLLVVIS